MQIVEQLKQLLDFLSLPFQISFLSSRFLFLPLSFSFSLSLSLSLSSAVRNSSGNFVPIVQYVATGGDPETKEGSLKRVLRADRPLGTRNDTTEQRKQKRLRVSMQNNETNFGPYFACHDYVCIVLHTYTSYL